MNKQLMIELREPSEVPVELFPVFLMQKIT
jgi:hypothetical protein